MDKEMEAIHAIQLGSKTLKDLPEWKNNKNVVLAAVQKNAYFFLDASDALRRNRRFYLQAILKNGSVLFVLPMDIEKDDEMFAYAAYSDKPIELTDEFKARADAFLKKKAKLLHLADLSLHRSKINPVRKTIRTFLKDDLLILIHRAGQSGGRRKSKKFYHSL